jgi:GSCFA family
MDPFRTIAEIQPSRKKIAYSSSLLFMGSCFSDTMGEKLESLKFQVQTNPFGVLFNPASIAENIRILMENKPFTRDRLYFHNGQWISFNHYTGYSHPDPEKCLDRINRNLASSASLLKKAAFLFLTFGTAWVYRFNETGAIVANCHKLPASFFTRSLLDPDEIIRMYNKLLQEIRAFNPELTVVFTLSPVRHWKDGAVNNQKSKSILHFAIDEIAEQNSGIFYFPAYEIFMDELRDYRFYARDMLHPSESGIEYTWERFLETYMDPDTLPLMKEVQSLVKAAYHRPVNPDDPSNKSFLQTSIAAMNYISEMHPFLDFSQEIARLERQRDES